MLYFSLNFKTKASLTKSPSKASSKLLARKQPEVDSNFDDEPSRKKITLDLSSSYVPFNKDPVAPTIPEIAKTDGKFIFFHISELFLFESSKFSS